MQNLTDLFSGLSVDLISAILEQKSETAVNLLNQDNVKEFFEIPNAIGETALYFAVLFRNRKIIKMLLQKGADLAKKNVHGVYALQNLFSNDFYFRDEQFSLTLSVLKYLTAYLAQFPLPSCDSPLHLAVEYSRNKTLTSLITKENINLKNLDGNTPLHFAASKGNTVALQVLVERGAELSCQNNNGDTPLFLALKNKHGEVIQILLRSKQIDFFAKNKSGDTALHFAVKTQYIQYIKFLVEKRCDLNAMNSQHETPISLALSLNNPVIVKYFFKENKEKITFLPSKLPATIVYFNVKHHRKMLNATQKIFEKIKQRKEVNGFAFFLLKLKPNKESFSIKQYKLNQELPNHVQVILKTYHAKCIVLAEEDQECQEFLLKGSATDNFSFLVLEDQPQAQDGNQYLHLAARAGREDVVKFLLDSGANQNSINFFGKTPLFLALEAVTREVITKEIITKEVITLLLKKQQYFSIKDVYGNSLLHSAILLGDLIIIEMLLKDIDINSVNYQGESALFIAVSRDLRITKYLITQGANCRLVCRDGNTILHRAAQFLDAEKMSYLFALIKEQLTTEEFLLLLKAKNYLQMSPLHWATLINPDIKVLQVLCVAGVNIYETDAEGLTSLHCAASAGNLSAIKYFIEDAKMRIDVQSTKGKKWNEGGVFDQTALHCAAAANQLEAVKQLLKYGANVNAKDSFNFTPLHCAVKENAVETISILMTHSLCNKRDCTEEILLDIASRYKAKSAFFYLKEIFSKAAIQKQQLSRNVPQNFASKMNNKKVQNFLINHSKSTQIVSVCSLRSEEVLEDDDLKSSSKSLNPDIEKKRKKTEEEEEEINENSNPNYFNPEAVKNC